MRCFPGLSASGTLLCRYGREDLDVLGLSFRRELIDVSIIYTYFGEFHVQYVCLHFGVHLIVCVGTNAGVPFSRRAQASIADNVAAEAPEKVGKKCVPLHVYCKPVTNCSFSYLL